METFEAMRRRRPVRSFSNKQVPDEDINQIIQAAGMAAVGVVAWKSLFLTVVQKPELLKEIDMASAKIFGMPQAHPSYDAPTLIILSSAPIKNESIEYAVTGCILENMILMAADLGLNCIYLWGSATGIGEEHELSEKLGIPAGYIPISVLALGYGSGSEDEGETAAAKQGPEGRIAMEFVR